MKEFCKTVFLRMLERTLYPAYSNKKLILFFVYFHKIPSHDVNY